MLLPWIARASVLLCVLIPSLLAERTAWLTLVLVPTIILGGFIPKGPNDDLIHSESTFLQQVVNLDCMSLKNILGS